MAEISEKLLETNLRELTFGALDIEANHSFTKVNDRAYGILLHDLNGVERYVRLQAVVAHERTDMTAEELMNAEIDQYKIACDRREAQRLKNEQKAAKAKRKAEESASA